MWVVKCAPLFQRKLLSVQCATEKRCGCSEPLFPGPFFPRISTQLFKHDVYSYVYWTVHHLDS